MCMFHARRFCSWEFKEAIILLQVKWGVNWFPKGECGIWTVALSRAIITRGGGEAFTLTQWHQRLLRTAASPLLEVPPNLLWIIETVPRDIYSF